MTFWLYYFDKMNILINNMMEIIKLPRNLKDINSRLPKKRYREENEMMEKEEYETKKAFYFLEVKNQMNNNGNLIMIKFIIPKNL